MTVRWGDEGPVNPFQMVRDSRPDMLVCIGGDSETSHIVEAHRELRGRTPIYVMATTGGVSERLAREASDFFRPFDRQFMRELQEAMRDGDLRSALVQGIPPYPLIMQRLMDTLIEHDQYNLER